MKANADVYRVADERFYMRKDATGNSGTTFCSTLPRAMVLVYQPELTHSVWQDWISKHRTRKGMEQRLRQGVRNGEWVAWRLMHIEKEVMGNV